MSYQFKPWAELAWAALVAAVVYILGALLIFEPAEILDWRSWLMALASGTVRAMAGALLAIITRPSQ